LRFVLALFVIVALPLLAAADSTALLRGLDTDDAKALSDAIAVIERAPTEPGLADVLFAAGRACEDRLYDPARALALYERILREMPDAGVSIAAGRRAQLLRGTREHAREAAQLAQLIATADALPPAVVETRASELASAHWPGAVDAALFLADWLCRTGRYADAHARYATLIAAHPDSDRVHLARRNAAGCAIDAKDWNRAEQLAQQLSSGDIDEALRADIMTSIETGRRRARLYSASWVALIIGGALLLLSLVEAIVRGGVKAPAWHPPVEVMFIAPVAAVVVAAAFAIDRLIAPAVVQILVTGLLAAWVSGATIDLLRTRGRHIVLRSVLQFVACGSIVLAVGYIAMSRDGLLDMLTETVKFGPGA
jgi:tetratricopeptide (TPR) repeat protein